VWNGKAEYGLQGGLQQVCRVAPETALPSEPEIAAQLGISRSTARAILTRLSEEGIIRWNKRQKVVLRAADGRRFLSLGRNRFAA
jgi:DNA-binding FadR family transcriptional regulator